MVPASLSAGRTGLLRSEDDPRYFRICPAGV